MEVGNASSLDIRNSSVDYAPEVASTHVYPDDFSSDVKEALKSFLYSGYSGPLSTNHTADIWDPAIWLPVTNNTDPCELWTNASQFFNCSSVNNTLAMGNQSFGNVTEMEPKYDTGLTVLFSLLAAVVSIVTILGNLLVLVAFFVDRSIRQPSNYFIASLAVSDFILGLSSMPLYTMYELLGYWPLGQWICDFWLSLDYTVCLTSQYTVFFITLDRFCSVKLPAKYRNWRTERKILIMVAVTWIIPILIFFISIIGWQFFVGVRTVPRDQCYVQFMESPIFNAVLVIGYYWITLVVMCGLYSAIYQVAWKLQRKSEEKHKKMTSIVTMGNAMTKLGMGMANNADDKKQHKNASSKKPIKATKKYSNTSFTSKDKEEGSSAAYASDSESNTPKPSPKHKRDGTAKSNHEQNSANATLMVPMIHLAPTNGLEPSKSPPAYNSLVNNNVNGDVYKEIDHDIKKDEEIQQNSTFTTQSSNAQQPHPFDPASSPESPVWKKRADFPDADEILPTCDGAPPTSGGIYVDTISEHANGKTVTKVVPRGRRIRLNLNAVVQRISSANPLRKTKKKKVPTATLR